MYSIYKIVNNAAEAEELLSQVSLGKFVSERPCWLLAAGHYNSQVEFKVSNAKTETKKKRTNTKTITNVKS